MDDEDFILGKTKALRKDIKRGKTFAIQHLTRRIKMIKNKRGTEQQVEKNARKAARFQEELEYIKELDIDTVVGKIENDDTNCSTMTTVDDVQQRALAKVIMSKPVQNHFNLSNTVSPKTQSSINTQAIPHKKASSKFKPKQESHSLSSNLPLAPCTANVEDFVKSDDEIELDKTASSVFVDSLSSVKTQDQRTTQNIKSGKQKENNLNYSKSRNDKTSRKERKKSSNRMGQRARQRLWKEQYGKKAKHMKSNDKTAKPKHHRTDKKLKANENRKPRKERMTTKGAKRKEEETASHPSWEASKRRKLQQNISQTKFQGQKITFDDSD